MAESIGKYEIIKPLGKGATATVYLCKDPEVDRQVAVKVIQLGKDNAAMSRRLMKLFQTEAGIGRRLDHPNIVKIYDAVVEPDRAYIAMEYIEGTALDQYVSINKLMPLHRVVGIIFKCCMAFDYAYREGVIHRDIKPANIMLTKDDEPKIADFGLSLNLQREEGRDSTFIMGVGSPAYMSPEQIKQYPLNQKTDLYSLGVLLFQMLTGRLPFRANNPATLVYRIINLDTPSVCALNPNLPPALDPIIKKALEKDLYNRYKNGAEFAKDLSAVRYQILEDDDPQQDFRHFEVLRKLPFFVDFDDIEVWEALRICVWRDFAAKVALMKEGDEDRTFGIIVSGCVEVSIEGRAVCRLNPGDVVGEMAYLHPKSAKRRATVVTLEPTVFLEVNPAALALSSEEVQERFQKVLVGRVLDRLALADVALAQHGSLAVKAEGGAAGSAPKGGSSTLELL